MKTLAFASKTDAEARSREEWQKRLGRERRPGDVTEFLWAVDGAGLLVPDEDASRLTPTEQRVLVAFVDKAAAADLADEAGRITRG